MATNFVPNPDFEPVFLASPTVRAFCESMANAVARAAEAKAPRRLGFLEGGIEGEAVQDRGRWVGRVWSHDWKTMLIEHGTRRMRARPFLFPAIMEVLPGARITKGRE